MFFFFLHVLGEKEGAWQEDVHRGLTSEGASDFNELPCGIYKLLLFFFCYSLEVHKAFSIIWATIVGQFYLAKWESSLEKIYLLFFSSFSSARIHLSNVFSDRPQKNFEHFSRASVDEQKKM